jgi:hypothetical protein
MHAGFLDSILLRYSFLDFNLFCFSYFKIKMGRVFLLDLEGKGKYYICSHCRTPLAVLEDIEMNV